MKFYTITTLLVLFVVMSCQTKKQATSKEALPNEEHNTTEAHRNKADEQMHRTSVAKLIKIFESPERDAYQQPEKVLAYIGDMKGKKILDIGAGSGYFSVKLAKKGAHVIAGDVDDEFLKYLKERIQKEQLDTLIEVRKLPYDSPDLRNEEVDKVLIVNTYHHIEDRPTYFAKVLQGLKKDGELIVIDFYKRKLPIGPPPPHKIAKEIVLKELKQAGFTNLEINTDVLKMQFIIRAKR